MSGSQPSSTDGASSQPPIIVSSCLAGFPCRYDGAARPILEIVELVAEGNAIPVCAEQLGGMSTPRPPVEIVGGSGADVLDGTARVVDINGADKTEELLAGARKAADIATQTGATRAILQARSPSCGCTQIYDGTHTGQLRSGMGVFAAELQRRGLVLEDQRGQATA